MCGIAGCWQSDWDVDAALDLIAHRGPDGRGIVRAAGGAVHGHVRLSILDPLPRSDQPFVRGHITLSYVGECWNYRELREELAGLGYHFETEGDTEVVAVALTEWGADALKRLEGQFAFAWTHEGLGETWLARDRFGEVPLYVLRTHGDLFNPGGFMWASERKAFGEDFAAEADPVPAGAVWRLDEPQPRFYYESSWALQGPGEPDPAGVLAILERSVDRRLQADVPVCCLISGGIDSSLILSLVKQRKPDVVAYTIVFDEDSPDLAEARYVAGELDVELREVPVPRPDEAAWREAIRAIEITMKAQIEIAAHCLPLAERIYADGFRVVLSGEGADELFGGYGMLARQMGRTPKSEWGRVRLEGVEKMARGNFVRINKAFMAHGVEARTPYMDREMVEAVIPLSWTECPTQKLLLREAATGLIPERIRTRKKLSFQSGSGMRDYAEVALNGQQQLRYNQIAREVFGGLPRG
ncbi:MAG TPA: asparagine synthase-related protein [Longimicrobiales bacterium]